MFQTKGISVTGFLDVKEMLQRLGAITPDELKNLSQEYEGYLYGMVDDVFGFASFTAIDRVHEVVSALSRDHGLSIVTFSQIPVIGSACDEKLLRYRTEFKIDHEALSYFLVKSKTSAEFFWIEDNSEDFNSSGSKLSEQIKPPGLPI